MMLNVTEDVRDLFLDAQQLQADRAWTYAAQRHWRQRTKEEAAGRPEIVGDTAYCRDGYAFKVTPFTGMRYGT
jgi:hypothetical protein